MTKKQFAKTVVFIAIFFAILIPLTYIIRTNGDVKDRFVGFYAEKKNSIDVITVGSSPVFPYYNAAQMYGETGIVMYPLSTNLQRPKAILPLIKEAEKYQNPKLYVIEMRMFTATDEVLSRNMAFTRGVTDNMRYSVNRVETINRLVDDVKHRYYYYFDIFKYHFNWKTMVLPSQMRTLFYAWPDKLKGFDIKDEVGPSDVLDLSDIKESQALAPDMETTLAELLEYLQANGADALFIVSPNTMTEERQKMYNRMREMIEPYGYAFLNMNDHYEEIGIDFQLDFDDYGGHTNALGAKKCTTYLENYLKDNYELPNHTGEEQYASYQKAYEYWLELQPEAEQTILDRYERGEWKVMEEE